MTNENIFKDAMARFATGVCVVTNPSTKVGITISSFASVSLEPAIVLYCVGNYTSNRTHYNQDNSVIIYGLADDAIAYSNYFASSKQDPSDFDDKVKLMAQSSTFILNGKVKSTVLLVIMILI